MFAASSCLIFDPQKWACVDMSFHGVPQRRRRSVFTHNFELPPPDARATTLASCAFPGVVGTTTTPHSPFTRSLDEPAYTVYGRGRPYFIFDDGTRRVTTWQESAALQSFPLSLPAELHFVNAGIMKLRPRRHAIEDAVPPEFARRLMKASEASWRGIDGDTLLLDLFCGMGGFGVGALLAGVKIFHAVDRDERRLKVYSHLLHEVARLVGTKIVVYTVCLDLTEKAAWDDVVKHTRVQLMQLLSPNNPHGKLHIHASPPCTAVSAANQSCAQRAQQHATGALLLSRIDHFARQFPRAHISLEQGPLLLKAFPCLFRADA